MLFIPTKELVFKNIVYADVTEPPKVYQALVQNEELFWRQTKEFLRNQDIDFIDALPALRESLQNGNQPFPISKDLHLNAIGHLVIAELVLSEIRRHNLLR